MARLLLMRGGQKRGRGLRCWTPPYSLSSHAWPGGRIHNDVIVRPWLHDNESPREHTTNTPPRRGLTCSVAFSAVAGKLRVNVRHSGNAPAGINTSIEALTIVGPRQCVRDTIRVAGRNVAVVCDFLSLTTRSPSSYLYI
jgi:hypothetical protein